jgi:hypothetical protein
MKVRGRRWHKAALAAAFAAASIAFVAGILVPGRSPVQPEASGAGTGTDPAAGNARTPQIASGEDGGSAAPRPGLAETHRESAGPVTLVAAGDIACDPSSPSFNAGNGVGDECRAKAVARVIASIDPQAVLTLGDQQYEDGRYPDFKRSYDLSYGAFKAITYPSVGNHEYYSSPNAQGFFDYFGPQAGTAGEGWYSVNLGAWHVIALNSNCSIVGCGRGSPQYTWLEQDLAKSQSACTLAFWHAPRYSSGPHGPDTSVTPFWRLLREDDADLVLNGHDHIYERYVPQDATGQADPRGIREFVVGVGGAERYWIESVQPNSQVRNASAFGVLELTLKDGSYDWRFVPALDARFTDSGSANCV